MSRVRFDETWPGPVAGVDPPHRALHGARIDIKHGIDGDREAIVGQALAPVMGKGRIIHYALVRRGLAWDKPRWEVLATVGRRRLTLKARRLKPSQVHALVDALAGLDGARDVRLRGRFRDGR